MTFGDLHFVLRQVVHLGLQILPQTMHEQSLQLCVHLYLELQLTLEEVALFLQLHELVAAFGLLCVQQILVLAQVHVFHEVIQFKVVSAEHLHLVLIVPIWHDWIHTCLSSDEK